MDGRRGSIVDWSLLPCALGLCDGRTAFLAAWAYGTVSHHIADRARSGPLPTGPDDLFRARGVGRRHPLIGVLQRLASPPGSPRNLSTEGRTLPFRIAAPGHSSVLGEVHVRAAGYHGDRGGGDEPLGRGAG